MEIDPPSSKSLNGPIFLLFENKQYHPVGIIRGEELAGVQMSSEEI
jgi:hypothetical protein